LYVFDSRIDTAPDLIDVLLEQHGQIAAHFRAIESAAGPGRQEAFERLVGLLVAHERIEQEIVHPLARQCLPASVAVIDSRLHEEDEARRLLLQLRGHDSASDEFAVGLLVLRRTVLAHCRHEERYEFPGLRRGLPATLLLELAQAVRVRYPSMR
jgi:hypothetical protein